MEKLLYVLVLPKARFMGMRHITIRAAYDDSLAIGAKASPLTHTSYLDFGATLPVHVMRPVRALSLSSVAQESMMDKDRLQIGTTITEV
jgi:hypothetical protein